MFSQYDLTMGTYEYVLVDVTIVVVYVIQTTIEITITHNFDSIYHENGKYTIFTEMKGI